MNRQQHIRVLVIEDDDADFSLLCQLLSQTESVYIDAERAKGVEQAIAALSAKPFDIVLSDLNVPDSAGLGTFVRIHERFPELPVIVLTGHDDDVAALTAVQKGAQDYLVKGQTSADVLIRSIRYALERQKLLREVETNLQEVRTLRGLIPMCAWCKQIRDDRGYWKKVETYISEHTDATFSHGICPDCLSKIDPETYKMAKSEMPELFGHGTPDVPAGGTRKVRVLLVEDDTADAELIRRVAAEAKGIQVELFHTPRLSSALDHLARQRFDLVLCDLGLPDSQGLETLLRIHARNPVTPVVVLTGRHDAELAVEALRSGAQDYLEKGMFTGAALERVIRYSIERYSLLTELSGRLREIDRLQRERSHLLSMFAHDIKNAVLPASGFAQRILSGKTRNFSTDLAAIRESLSTAERLLTSFIDFSRFEKSEYKPALVPFDLEACVLKKIATMQVKAEEKDVKFVSDFPRPRLPEVMADEDMIQRVIGNLVDNAVKYTPPGGTVTIRGREVDDAILVEVMDNGVGISADHIPYIFDAFYRLKGSQTGSGLGLAIARTIIKAHGGEIWVESTPGKGSTFSFTLKK
jgi:signal transduction histidine kinase/anti-anti-sigma regulatory factor